MPHAASPRSPDRALAGWLGRRLGWWLFELEATLGRLGPCARLVRLARGGGEGGGPNRLAVSGPRIAPRARVRLVLPEDDIFVVPLDLPAVAVMRLETLLALRVSAEWPLPGEPPAWRAELALGAGMRLIGALAMVRADLWREAVELARARRLRVVGIALSERGGDCGEIGRDGSPAQRPAAPWRAVAALVALALGLGAWSHLDGLHRARADAEGELADLRAAARPAMAQAARDQAMLDLLHALAARTASRGRGIDILEALARGLPDDTWLEEVEIDRARVRLRGRTGDPARTLRAVAVGTPFANARFAAPVVTEDGGALSRFELLLDRPVREPPSGMAR